MKNDNPPSASSSIFALNHETFLRASGGKQTPFRRLDNLL
jgi:hypothetical protein